MSEQVDLMEPDCVKACIQRAEVVAAGYGKRMTPVRTYIYKRLLKEGPLGAYELLDGLKGIGNSQPPTAYRALEFLESIGLVRKLRGVSKYIALSGESSSELTSYVVCRECGATEQAMLDDRAVSVFEQARTLGFSEIDQVIELIGVCSNQSCKDAASSPHG